MNYTNEKFADILPILGDVHGNSGEAEWFYAEMFTNRQT
jgi:hypothetical protein